MVQTNTDGSCWLSVLIVSMSCTPELAQLVDGLTTRAARDRLVDESTKNWDRHYKDFFTNDVRDTYLADTTLHGTYGDHAALAAFATTFHVKIRVWGATEDVDHVVVPNGAQGEVEVNIGPRRTDSDSDSDHYFAVHMGIVPPPPPSTPRPSPTTTTLPRNHDTSTRVRVHLHMPLLPVHAGLTACGGKVFAFMYIQVAKPYESLRSAHTFEYMPRTWTEVDEGEWRKERDAVSRTDAERLPNEEPSRSDAEGLANDEDGTLATHF